MTVVSGNPDGFYPADGQGVDLFPGNILLQQDERVHASPSPVCRHGGTHVAGGKGTDAPIAQGEGALEAQGCSSILKGPGRVLGLVLEQELLQLQFLAQVVGPDQGCPSSPKERDGSVFR